MEGGYPFGERRPSRPADAKDPAAAIAYAAELLRKGSFGWGPKIVFCEHLYRGCAAVEGHGLVYWEDLWADPVSPEDRKEVLTAVYRYGG
jgi:hypothetical protein